MQIGIFIGQSFAFDFGPDHEGVHRPTDALFSGFFVVGGRQFAVGGGGSVASASTSFENTGVHHSGTAWSVHPAVVVHVAVRKIRRRDGLRMRWCRRIADAHGCSHVKVARSSVVITAVTRRRGGCVVGGIGRLVVTCCKSGRIHSAVRSDGASESFHDSIHLLTDTRLICPMKSKNVQKVSVVYEHRFTRFMSNQLQR